MTTTHTLPTPAPVFSKVCRVPDFLVDGDPVLSLYADHEQVLHMQARLRDSGHLVLFPVTFRLVNRYLSGDFTLAELIERAPSDTVTLVTRAHNLLPIDKLGFDLGRLRFAHKRYPLIRHCKQASVDEIRRGLHACMRD